MVKHCTVILRVFYDYYDHGYFFLRLDTQRIFYGYVKVIIAVVRLLGINVYYTLVTVIVRLYYGYFMFQTLLLLSAFISIPLDRIDLSAHSPGHCTHLRAGGR